MRPGDYVKMYRENMRLTQAELGKKVNMPEPIFVMSSTITERSVKILQRNSQSCLRYLQFILFNTWNTYLSNHHDKVSRGARTDRV
jgi:hypothetical protein